MTFAFHDKKGPPDGGPFLLESQFDKVLGANVTSAFSGRPPQWVRDKGFRMTKATPTRQQRQ